MVQKITTYEGVAGGCVDYACCDLYTIVAEEYNVR